jgi:methylated-DNA-[protein]-cysteine S-methyltransferase
MQSESTRGPSADPVTDLNAWTTVHATPIGPLRVVVDDHGRLLEVVFQGGAAATPAGESRERCAHVTRQLDEYFAGARREFDLDVVFAGTPFQQEVWRELQRIPFGVTISYRELAERIGRPKAMRAVGQANGRNRIPVVVPCHRVIGASGELTGFGGGLDIKRRLLEVERVVPAPRLFEA